MKHQEEMEEEVHIDFSFLDGREKVNGVHLLREGGEVGEVVFRLSRRPAPHSQGLVSMDDPFEYARPPLYFKTLL